MAVKLEYNHLSNFSHCLDEKMRTFAFSYLMTKALLDSGKDFYHFWS